MGASLAILAMLGVLVLTIYLLRANWRGRPVAAALTRVAGVTRVETAVAASRFWLTPPQFVVTTSAGASQQVMWWAAHCAMLHDAPLLFTSPDRRRQQLVNATIKGWRRKHTAPRVIEVRDVQDKARCLASGRRADISGLSTPYIPGRPLPLRIIPVQATLAPVVVFAAAKAHGDPPDVAVGMALAAHMATPARPVSLVVVPRYLEADPELVSYLRDQRELVQGGIVLGQVRVLPDDTAALLRQLLAAVNRQDFWSQLQADLGTLGSLIPALLALLGLGAATALALVISHQVVLLRESVERASYLSRDDIAVDPIRRRRSRDQPGAPVARAQQVSQTLVKLLAMTAGIRGYVQEYVLGPWPALRDLKLSDDRLPSDKEMRLLEAELLTFGLAEPGKRFQELAKRLDDFLERVRTFINFGFTRPVRLGGTVAGGIHTDELPLSEDERRRRANEDALSEQINMNGKLLKDACDKLNSAVRAEINRFSTPVRTRERAVAEHSGTQRLAVDLPGLMGPPDPLV